MLKNLRYFVFFPMILLASNVDSAEKSPASPVSPETGTSRMIGKLKNSHVVDGCSCSFQFPADWSDKKSFKPIFLSEIEGPPAYMNIDGQDVKMTRVGPEPTHAELKKGTRFTKNYRAQDTKVIVEFTATWLCPPKDESCEVTHYDGTLSVLKGSRKETVKAKGDCGC